jgi:hypothetical protein
MGKMKDLVIQDGFICNHCELPLPQSPTWEEFCIYCTMMMLENDMQENHAVHQAIVEKMWNE